MATEFGTELRCDVSLGDFSGWMVSEQSRIFLLCRRMLQDAGEADSASQDVFLKAFNALQRREISVVELERPDRWLTRIAVNTCLDRLRSDTWKIWQRRPAPEAEQTILGMAADGAPDAERQMFARQIQRRLEAALGKLSGRQRAVFALRHYEDLPLDEIAAVLGLDLGTVKSHLFRAITKLRGELRDLYVSQPEAARRNA